MKKLVFTAFAVVAFSGVAMANSLEVKESTILNNELKIVEVQERATPCQDMMIDIYEYTMDTYNCGGDDINLLNALLSNCN